MKCVKCGNELQNSALFCDNCGQKVEAYIEETQKCYCGNCGAEISNWIEFCGNCGCRISNAGQSKTNSIFCGGCGAEIESGVQFCGECGFAVNSEQNNEAIANKPEKKKRRTGLIIVPFVVVCLAIAIIIGFMIYSREDDDAVNNDTSTKVTATVTPENEEDSFVNVSPSDTEGLNQKVSGASKSSRTDLYNDSLIYKRMQDIQNTVLVDDGTFNDLKTVIEEFEVQCADYMNEITDAVPSYLKQGTTAYEQQVEYKQKHPTLNQTYQKVDVINARQGGGYYYVWVTEMLNVNENGVTKVVTDHWVYKLENNNGHWYICDYTSDPAF